MTQRRTAHRPLAQNARSGSLVAQDGNVDRYTLTMTRVPYEIFGAERATGYVVGGISPLG